MLTVFYYIQTAAALGLIVAPVLALLERFYIRQGGDMS